MEELLEIVNEEGRVIGTALRSEAHGNNSLLHRVVHVIVTNNAGDIFLQKRAATKDVAPGKWDTSVGGHVDAGESVEEALRREMTEELGVPDGEVVFLYRYIHSNPYESELVYTYRCRNGGPFRYSRDEIDEVRFWQVDEIKREIGKGIFSDNFEDEFDMFTKLEDTYDF
ncbi:nudix hydrolase [bacterium BMS3Bbin06]|nr:nudix hydrolase [bacterium BMS3Abin08]GBE35728.1 nudix hydrolase [bacterium BMS3Bbin06]HDO35801.1 NUDIX domain-containing protein [Nitrospirota bacterium]HDY70829.1 NUDIX domain-containing protein [Nitrospirota bacterium]